MIVCSVNNISKSYAGNQIFEELSFELKKGERVGLIGRNGSGKTTLMKCLARVDEIEAGQIHWSKDSRIGYLSQIPSYIEGTMTKDILRSAFDLLMKIELEMKKLEEQMAEIEENQLQKVMDQYGKLQERFATEGGYEIDSNIQRVSHGLNIQSLLDQDFESLSGGEQTKVGLALNLLKQPDLLLLDEPTNHLDLVANEWLGEFLSHYDGTVVVISHDRYFLDEVVTKIIDLEDGELTIYHTNFSGYVKEKEEKILREFQAYEEQQRKIKKMKERAKQLRIWANQAKPPNAGLHRQARNMERMIERMDKVKRPYIGKKLQLDMGGAERSGNEVIVTRNLAKSFGSQALFEDVNIQVRFGERVAIIGENGTGKSTLLKIILGYLEPDIGEVKLGSQIKIGYLSQHIFSDETLQDEKVIDVFRDQVSMTEGEARHTLARFLFYGADVFQKLSSLSGGEKMRLRLAQLMHQDTNLLVLDEPTNHLDIESREVLEEALLEFDGTILGVSHDRYFLDKLFQKVYWIESRKVIEFSGDYAWSKKKMDELRNNPVS